MVAIFFLLPVMLVIGLVMAYRDLVNSISFPKSTISIDRICLVPRYVQVDNVFMGIVGDLVDDMPASQLAGRLTEKFRGYIADKQLYGMHVSVLARLLAERICDASQDDLTLISAIIFHIAPPPEKGSLYPDRALKNALLDSAAKIRDSDKTRRGAIVRFPRTAL